MILFHLFEKIDHHLTTTVQRHHKIPEKPVVITDNRLFSCFGGKCAEPIKFTFQRPFTPPCRSSPTRKARGSNPPGRTKSSTLWGAALFCFAWILWSSKRADSNSPCPALCVRGAETPRWGVSRAWLGESLRAHLKIALQCTLRSKAVIVGLIFNTRQKTISVSHIVMFAEKNL